MRTTQVNFSTAKKLFILNLSCISMAFAASTIASAPAASNSCDPLQAQVRAGREIIKQAYIKEDACTLGKQEIANHKIIQANLACFPNFRKDDYNLFHVMDQIDTAIENNQTPCDKSHASVMANHQKIKQALTKNDGCTAGKLQIQNHKTIQANLMCFPGIQQGEYHVNSTAPKYDASGTNSN